MVKLAEGGLTMRVPAICLAFALGACTTVHTVSPVAGEGQQLRFDGGIGQLTSTGKQSVVMVQPIAESFSSRVELVVTASNISQTPIDLIPEGISISDIRGRKLALVSYSRAVQEARNAAVSTRLAIESDRNAALAAVAQPATTTTATATAATGAAAAATPTGQPVAVGTVANSQSATVQATYDPVRAQAAAAAARAEADARRLELEARLNAQTEALGASMLRRTTVDPGETAGGVLVADGLRKGSGPLTMEVRMGEDVHTFRFDVQP